MLKLATLALSLLFFARLCAGGLMMYMGFFNPLGGGLFIVTLFSAFWVNLILIHLRLKKLDEYYELTRSSKFLLVITFINLALYLGFQIDGDNHNSWVVLVNGYLLKFSLTITFTS